MSFTPPPTRPSSRTARATGALGFARPALLAALSATLLAATPARAQTAAGTGLDEIGALGRINGTALACQDLGTARRAKALMLKHAPKTERYGTRFDEATQEGFRAVTGNQAECPSDPNTLPKRLEQIEPLLRAALPVTEGQP